MKTLLLALALIGATVALLALLGRGQGGEARLEPRARPARIAQVTPDATLVPPAPVDPPGVDASGLVPTADPAPGETRVAVPELAASTLLVGGQPFEVLDAGMEIRLLDLIQTTSGVIVPGRFVVSGQVLRTIESRTIEEKRPDGTWIETYDGDRPKAQGQIRNGREVGLWIYWHENGERSAEGRYVIGERHGLWTHWHPDGSKKSEGAYNYRKREGSWIDFHPGGKKQQVATYVNGVFVGRVVRWHSNGAKESEGFCVGGDLDGPWRGWHANGMMSSHGSYRYGQRVGRWTFFDANGVLDESQSGRYENGQKVE